jgi:lipoate-protein ligase A
MKWRWWSRRTLETETSPPERGEPASSRNDLRVSGRKAVGAGGDLRGNAFGPGSSTTHIDSTTQSAF